MTDVAGPVGYQHIETAPKDGSWLRFRFRRVEHANEVVGRWESHAEMKTGGSWFDREGCYITPGPIFWARHNVKHRSDCPSGDFGPCDCPLSNGESK